MPVDLVAALAALDSPLRVDFAGLFSCVHFRYPKIPRSSVRYRRSGEHAGGDTLGGHAVALVVSLILANGITELLFSVKLFEPFLFRDAKRYRPTGDQSSATRAIIPHLASIKSKWTVAHSKSPWLVPNLTRRCCEITKAIPDTYRRPRQ